MCHLKVGFLNRRRDVDCGYFNAYIVYLYIVITTYQCKYIYIYIYHNILFIQGDSGGICITLGNDSMSVSKQKSSYEHGYDFERLRSYGHFLIPVHALM